MAVGLAACSSDDELTEDPPVENPDNPDESDPDDPDAPTGTKTLILQ